MRPALVSVASCPATNGATPPLLPPPNTALVASMSRRPLPLALSPSTRVPSKASWVSWRRATCSQLLKRATPLVLTLSKPSTSLPGPPSKDGNAPRWAVLRLLSCATSSPSPMSIAPYTTPPPFQVSRSLPKLRRISPRTVPPVRVTASSPPLTLMLPPI